MLVLLYKMYCQLVVKLHVVTVRNTHTVNVKISVVINFGEEALTRTDDMLA